MLTSRRLTCLFSLVGSVCACSSSSQGNKSNTVGTTQGDLGNATFAYAGAGCILFVCPVSRAIMLGSTEPVAVSPVSGSVPVVTASTSDGTLLQASITTRECCQRSANSETCRTIDPTTDCASAETASVELSVVALGVGHAKVLLLTSDGSTYDSLDFPSEPAASLALSCQSSQSSVTDIAVASTCFMRWDALDAGGTALESSTGVTLSVSPLSVAGFEQGLGSPVAQQDGDQGTLLGTSLVGLAAGDATITASAKATTAVGATLVMHVH
jgi:hypothetical protein